MQILSFLIAATLTAGALARFLSPFSDDSTIGRAATFSLKQVRNPKFVRNGPIQLARIYHKYGVPLPDDLKAAVARIRGHAGKRSTGSAQTNPEKNDVEYLTPVSIGTPGQVLNLDLDTGSSDLWVFSSLTTSSQVNGQTLYDPTKSTTANQLQGYTWQISYGDGSSSSGDVYTDTVTVGGVTFSAQAVQVAKTVSSEFTSDPANHGLLGMGFGSINTVEPVAQKTFFDNIMPDLDLPLFTADLKRSAPGRYNFGYIDPSAYKGEITYVPVDNDSGFWAWTSPAYAIGSRNFGNTTLKGIADTGASLFLLPSAAVSEYYGAVFGAKYDRSQGAFTVPCDASAPDFTFVVGDHGATITVPGNYIKYAPIDDAGKTCFGGIQLDTGIGFSIFGDVALKSAFVVFNGGNRTIGWATKAISSSGKDELKTTGSGA
ncbi:aspartic peptidase domain-containing protein [Achaetomium macrosporum]|uniref:Aspartic peptidase domain-containing protein n=1 Tax=Achaetomium macrosporum TaxID=79813 RepID=A0AAN7H7D3_9PEZI|nr:aspartic peptidase domain-containing protein [Achaetomium macrosporum]